MTEHRNILGVSAHTTKNNVRGNFSKQKNEELLLHIKSIIAEHTLKDKEWIKAISSQYFLIGIAKVLDYCDQDDYKQVLEASLSSFKLRYDGGYRIDEKNILIIPEENKKLIKCMQKEDSEDDYYKGRLGADLIDRPDVLYQNYHYGLMIKICSAEDTDNLRAIQKISMDELFKREVLDEYGGWYHYRLSWITARILISLKDVKYDSYSNKDIIKKTIDKALDSLIERIFDNKYWRSGAGEWVSKWESTALCLEALMLHDYIKKNKTKIDDVVKYLVDANSLSEWLKEPIFDNETQTNNTLASIVLASNLYIIIKKYYKNQYANIIEKITIFFEQCISILLKDKSKRNNFRQHCTIPEILYYISVAIKS